MLLFVAILIRMDSVFYTSVLGAANHFGIVGLVSPSRRVQPVSDASGDVSDNSGVPVFAFTWVRYIQFAPDPPNWYWCDENGNVEDPPVVAQDYDGLTALRDGLAALVSGEYNPS